GDFRRDLRRAPRAGSGRPIELGSDAAFPVRQSVAPAPGRNPTTAVESLESLRVRRYRVGAASMAGVVLRMAKSYGVSPKELKEKIFSPERSDENRRIAKSAMSGVVAEIAAESKAERDLARRVQ